MEIPTRYTAAAIEKKWYEHWLNKDYFHSVPDEREPFTIVIPPPNVTGVLHMGHMLNNTIQDVLIRKARLDGKNACWVPGTDHASIATEAKVVKLLREQGIKKSDIDREAFLDHAWEWKNKYGGIILEQLRKLGASCDWKRTAFTMDEERSRSVLKAFIDLYNKGYIYRGLRMINWDPEATTVLSNEEVLYEEESGHLYYVRYRVDGSPNEFVTIATTRPETILGDTAIAVHPSDERYAHLKEKKVVVPVVNRVVPIIFDRYVDREFGTGALKITPAHDPNDHTIGQTHGLETIDIFNPDGTLSEAAGHYIGTDRFEARKMIITDLENSGALVKIESYVHSVGRSERTNAVVEPRLSEQWYVDMQKLAGPALEHVMNDDIQFFPANQKNTYRHWLENIRDWTISRQLWWGHRIPAYYLASEGGEQVFVAPSIEAALAQAKEKTGNAALTEGDLRQDEDVLDTWFSSWLWPISVFHGFTDRKELEYYYPTSVLVTGWDIIFLWVARMIMAGYEWENEKPFKHVYFTGMVRDSQRRKMSKSLGNSPDALLLIDEYGADGVRFGMLSSSPAGGDLLFDVKLCEQGRNFSNKIWNAMRLITTWEIDRTLSQPDENIFIIQWLDERLNEVLAELDSYYGQYKLSDALMSLYNFVWNDFFSWYLEAIKPAFGQPMDSLTYEATVSFFEKILTVLHPFMPFITEEVWHYIRERKEGEDCIVSSYPGYRPVDQEFLEHGLRLKKLVTKIREIRNSKGLKPKEPLQLFVQESDGISHFYHAKGIVSLLGKMAYLDRFEISQTDDIDNAISFLSSDEKYFLVLRVAIDVEEERAKLEKELEYQQGFVSAVQKKLNNERFVNNAPEDVVNIERKKLADGLDRMRILTESIQKLQ